MQPIKIAMDWIGISATKINLYSAFVEAILYNFGSYSFAQSYEYILVGAK